MWRYFESLCDSKAIGIENVGESDGEDIVIPPTREISLRVAQMVCDAVNKTALNSPLNVK